MKNAKIAICLTSALFLGACEEGEVNKIIDDTINNSTVIILTRADQPKLKYSMLLSENPKSTPRWSYTITVNGDDGCTKEEGKFCKTLYKAEGVVGDSDAQRAPWAKLLGDSEADGQACQQTEIETGGDKKRACEGNRLTIQHLLSIYAFDKDSSLTSLVDLKETVGRLFRESKPKDPEGTKLGTDALPYPLP